MNKRAFDDVCYDELEIHVRKYSCSMKDICNYIEWYFAKSDADAIWPRMIVWEDAISLLSRFDSNYKNELNEDKELNPMMTLLAACGGDAHIFLYVLRSKNHMYKAIYRWYLSKKQEKEPNKTWTVSNNVDSV